VAERYSAECPAKINLYLRVGEPDARGYHPLETEFQAIGLFDTLTVELGGSGFTAEGAELPEENTVTKGLRLMREVATLPPLGIRLVKRIPSEAGLGGGSSDAGGLLRILRKLLPSTVPDREFLAVARSVGADVPFFLVGGRARGEGYGDVLTALEDEPTRWLVVVKPPVSCSTPEMYAALDAVARGGSASNDFEQVAPAECSRLISALSLAGLAPVGLCGSGSAVYGFARSEAEAGEVARRYPGSWDVRTLSRAESLAVTRSE